MKTIKAILLSLLFLAAACQQQSEAPEPLDYGYLSLNLSLTITSEPANGRTLAVSTDDFRVTIFAADGTEVMVFDPFSTAPAEVQLPTGEYYVEAHSNNMVDAAFENPYYFGRSDNFTIDKEELKSIDIEAELANTKVAINYSANVVNTFHSYTGTVTVVSSGASLFYAQGETREGYFVTSPLDIEVNLSYTKLDGTTIDRTFTASIADPQPKTLYNINVDASLEDGKVVFNITVDEGFDTVDIDLGDATGSPNANWSPGEEWVDERDNEVYGTVQIGDQVWMSENLRYLPEIHNNQEFVSQGAGEVSGYGIYDYDGNDKSEAIQLPNYEAYGVLYNWYAAMDGEESSDAVPSGVNGACPADWHVPSFAEWNNLATTLGGTSNAGDKLKEAGELTWMAPNETSTNESGFSGRGAGLRNSGGYFNSLKIIGRFWSSAASASNANVAQLSIGASYLLLNNNEKELGLSIRCIKD